MKFSLRIVKSHLFNPGTLVVLEATAQPIVSQPNNYHCPWLNSSHPMEIYNEWTVHYLVVIGLAFLQQMAK